LPSEARLDGATMRLFCGRRCFRENAKKLTSNKISAHITDRCGDHIAGFGHGDRIAVDRDGFGLDAGFTFRDASILSPDGSPSRRARPARCCLLTHFAGFQQLAANDVMLI
jgi:hypothetical protein